jgi:serine/threonine protein kinase
MEQPAEFCEHLASCPQCQAFIDQLSDSPEMRRWAPARQCLLKSEPSEPALDRLLEELRSTPPADNRSPEGVGEPAGTSLGFLEAPRQAGDLGALGPYRVLGELGRGGMGIVLLAYDPHLKRKAALKVLPPYRADEQARSRRTRGPGGRRH